MLDFLCKESYDLRDFVALITFLRSPDGCPWDQVQTHELSLIHISEPTRH